MQQYDPQNNEDDDGQDDGPQAVDLDESGDEQSDTAPCPACGREIYADAQQCPFCGRYVVMRVAHRRRGRWWKWLVAVATIIAVLCYFHAC